MRALALLATVVAALISRSAAAHGFGMRYDLPLPLDYFIVGGAAAVLMSFVIAAFVLRPNAATVSYPSIDLSATWLGAVVQCPTVHAGLRIFGVIVFLVTVIAGYIGAPNPYKNISIVMVWVIAWVGIAYASALVGNVWAVLNPWSTIFRWAEDAGLRPLGLRYPPWLGAWPASAQLFAFAWMEINWSGSGVPVNIAIALTIFSILTWGGMYLFGRDTWAHNGGVFVMVFGLFSRFAIFEMRNGRLHIRPPAVGLVTTEPASFSRIVFIILILSTVTYDGFAETELFQTLALALFEPLQGLGPIAAPIVSTVGLAAVPLLFTLAYLIVVVAMSLAGGTRRSPSTIAGSIVTSLVPIAIAYHFAHYLSLLVFEGQTVIALASDPFGFGWNLFGTAAYRVDLTVMNAKFLWFFSAAAIVAGHIAAVYLAHAEALRLFGTRHAALVSQIPLTALMIGYTMISLWIVAQPIVG